MIPGGAWHMTYASCIYTTSPRPAPNSPSPNRSNVQFRPQRDPSRGPADPRRCLPGAAKPDSLRITPLPTSRARRRRRHRNPDHRHGASVPDQALSGPGRARGRCVGCREDVIGAAIRRGERAAGAVLSDAADAIHHTDSRRDVASPPSLSLPRVARLTGIPQVHAIPRLGRPHLHRQTRHRRPHHPPRTLLPHPSNLPPHLHRQEAKPHQALPHPLLPARRPLTPNLHTLLRTHHRALRAPRRVLLLLQRSRRNRACRRRVRRRRLPPASVDGRVSAGLLCESRPHEGVAAAVFFESQVLGCSAAEMVQGS